MMTKTEVAELVNAFVKDGGTIRVVRSRQAAGVTRQKMHLTANRSCGKRVNLGYSMVNYRGLEERSRLGTMSATA